VCQVDVLKWMCNDDTQCKQFQNTWTLCQNIQFTWRQRDGHCPFQSTDICRRLNGSLGHKLYYKPTSTNFCLNSTSHHTFSNLESILTTSAQDHRLHCLGGGLLPVTVKGDLCRLDVAESKYGSRNVLSPTTLKGERFKVNNYVFNFKKVLIHF
jgi:hypothetical protein